MLRNCRHRAVHIAIHIIYVRDGRIVVDDGRVVHIGDRRLIDRGVAYVDAVHVLTAHLVRGNVNFTWTQREPRNVLAKRDPTSAYKDHEGGRINRGNFHRSWNPTPAAFDSHPAAVVKRSVAPGLIVDPGPSPGINPGPVALAIRSPACGNVRVPHVAIA